MSKMDGKLKPSLNGVLGDIARVASEDAALAIARELGGTRVYFPADPAPGHWLTKLVGSEAAKAICETLTGGFVGGARIDLPLGPTGTLEDGRSRLDALLIEGKLSERDIALETGYTTRTVRRRRAMLGKPRDSRQQDLFQD